MTHLILTRHTGEALKIGDDIEIRVMNVKGKQVRLGVTAPKDCTVMRPEVLERMAREQAEKSDK